MSVRKNISVTRDDGTIQEVAFAASAATPRIYRNLYQRDIYADITKLQAYIEGDKDINSLEMFEDVAYCMARQADNSIPSTVEEWLDQFSMFSIYEILPQLIELWALNVASTVETGKKNGKPRVK